MKKRLYAVLTGMACACMLTGFSSTDTQAAESDILKEMESANTEETLLSKHEKIGFRTTYTFADGTVCSTYSYGDSQRVVTEDDYGVVIDEHGDVYGFDNERKSAYHMLFADGTYEEYKDTYLNLDQFQVDAEESIVSQQEQDDIIKVCTSVDDQSFVDNVAVGYLYEAGDVESLAYEYEVDAESYELMKTTLYAVLPGGEKDLICESDTVLDPETYVVDEQIYKAVFEGDMRTVTVTENPGTEQEKVYTQTVSKGNDILLQLPSDCEGTLYTDEACTVKYEDIADKNADINLYFTR